MGNGKKSLEDNGISMILLAFFCTVDVFKYMFYSLKTPGEHLDLFALLMFNQCLPILTMCF